MTGRDKSADRSAPPPVVKVSAPNERIADYTARRRGVRVPAWVGMLAVGLVIGTVLAWAWQAHRAEIARRAGNDNAVLPERGASHPKPDRSRRFAPKKSARPAITPLAPGASWEEIYPVVENGIVKIETYDRSNERTGLGSGFVIDSRGLVATSYHVAAAAFDKADVLFNDGTRFGVEGYAVVQPARDLAILKLNGVPRNVRALRLRPSELPAGAPTVHAIGHPYDHNFVPTSGLLIRVVHTPDLAPPSQEFLDSFLGHVPDNRWLEHDAQISPGNSGGPLLNSTGQVIGINTWVNRETRLGYALDIGHLRDLVNEPPAEITPLRDHYQPPHELLAQIHAHPIDVSASRIDELMQAGFEFHWQVASPEEYKAFQDLAIGLTHALRTEELRAEGATDSVTADALIQRAREALAELRQFPWRADQASSFGQQANSAFATPLAGVFLLGRVEGLWEGEAERRGLLISFPPDDQALFVPLTDGLAPPEIGADCLVLGIAYPATVPVGEDQHQSRRAQVVLSKTILTVAPLADD